MRELAAQQGQAVHDVEHSLGAFDLADEEKQAAVLGKPRLQRCTGGASVVTGRRCEQPEIRSAVDHRVLAAPARSGREAPAGVARFADHAVGDALEQRVEPVVPRLIDEPHHFRGRTALGEATRDRVARGIGRDDVDASLAQHLADRA